MKDATVLHETNRHELRFLSKNIVYLFLQIYFSTFLLNSVLYYKPNFSIFPVCLTSAKISKSLTEVMLFY